MEFWNIWPAFSASVIRDKRSSTRLLIQRVASLYGRVVFVALDWHDAVGKDGKDCCNDETRAHSTAQDVCSASRKGGCVNKVY